MPRTLGNYELYRPQSTWSKLASPSMSRSGKGKAVDTSAHQPSYEDDNSDDDEYDDEDWKKIEDPGVRRKIQNRLAQRKFREKTRIAREESIRHSQNQAAARNAYSHPDPRDLQHGNASDGLPWGGISVKRVVERGNEREQQSARRSRESSVAYDTYGRGGGGGGDRGSGVSYYSSGRGGMTDSYSYYGSARGGSGGGGAGAGAGYSVGSGGRGTTSASDRAYYASSRGGNANSRSLGMHNRGVGLQLSNRFAMGRPAWEYLWFGAPGFGSGSDFGFGGGGTYNTAPYDPSSSRG